MNKFIKDLWTLTVERAETRKALRLLNKQVWSIEFLTAMLHRSAKCYGTHLEMTIVSKDGNQIILKTSDGPKSEHRDETIFDHLDNEVAVNQFIAQIGRKA